MPEELTLAVAHEWLAHDPFGKPKPTDVSEQLPRVVDTKGNIVLRAARNGYVSFRVLVRGKGEYRLSISMRGGIEADLFRAWYHRMAPKENEPVAWWSDALVPAREAQSFYLPDPHNAIDGQVMQEFWVDLFVPRDAKVGKTTGHVRIKSAGREDTSIGIVVNVLDHVIPDEPCITMDHNSYSCRWLSDMYPSVFSRALSGDRFWEAAIRLLHDYHRLVYEHRGLLHNLGYGHSSAFDPIYGPRAVGSGHEKRLVDWHYYDRHYGPLLDGSAFAKPATGAPPPRRAARPIWGVYTPINANWPASYLHWGERGYEVEFIRGLREFDAHLREKGWTTSHVELFFNHKKRFRWFEWDGDEPKYLKDIAYHVRMAEMWADAVTGSPVNWVYRMDASWQMKQQFSRLAGHRNFWVCGGFHRWYREELRAVQERGDIVWWYGGSPPVQAASSAILRYAYETWGRSLDGYCAWLTTNPGPDPWFNCTGANTGCIYPGDRFGIKGPIPSIRLKIQRNGIQDLDLLDHALKSTGTIKTARDKLAQMIPLRLWTKPPRTALELPPEDWTSQNLREEHEPEHEEKAKLDPAWWQLVRAQALAEEND